MTEYRVRTRVMLSFVNTVEAEDEEMAEEAAWAAIEEICIDIDDADGVEWLSASAEATS